MGGLLVFFGKHLFFVACDSIKQKSNQQEQQKKKEEDGFSQERKEAKKRL